MENNDKPMCLDKAGFKPDFSSLLDSKLSPGLENQKLTQACSCLIPPLVFPSFESL